jgi:OmpA-OmpF porin, OOP family
MKFKNKFITVSLATILATGLSACSHGPTVQDFPATASASDEVTKFSTDVSTAQADQVDMLSPANFRHVRSALRDAKKSLSKQKSEKDTLAYVATGRAYLTRSQEFARLSHNNIEDVIVARGEAITAGAPTHLTDEFSAADQALKEVTSAIEKNDLEEAIENRSALQLAYLDLELRAIKHERLNGPRKTIERAIKDGAKEFAPRSLAIAEKSVVDTDAYITANRHEFNEITVQSNATRASADHLLKITNDAKSGNKTSAEDSALRLESEQNKVANKQAQINVQRGQIAAGARENESLEAEQVLNRRFEQARAQFTEEEAVVYKQGNTLMIRLKSLEFPVAQAMLKGSNFAVLAKVQKVIRDFGPGSVIVEGHTDSNGGKALNERLSSERAEAVKEYFVSNNQGEPLDIKSVGYGYQKPLGTNKTAAGRAQNRRVDVLIQPESSFKL